MADQTTYATLEDLLRSLQRDEEDERILDQFESALTDATDAIDRELETDFWRHPSSNDETETRLLTGSGAALLHVHFGVVSLTTVRIRLDRLLDWVEIDAVDEIDLESRMATDHNQATATVYPFDHLRLNGTGLYSTWPAGPRLVELTGVFGWPAIPSRVVQACVDTARQSLAADRTYPGGVVTPDEAGLPVLPSRLPDALYRLKAWHSNLFAGCAT